MQLGLASHADSLLRYVKSSLSCLVRINCELMLIGHAYIVYSIQYMCCHFLMILKVASNVEYPSCFSQSVAILWFCLCMWDCGFKLVSWCLSFCQCNGVATATFLTVLLVSFTMRLRSQRQPTRWHERELIICFRSQFPVERHLIRLLINLPNSSWIIRNNLFPCQILSCQQVFAHSYVSY